MIKTLREHVFPKPSDAILAMVAELRNPSIAIDMSTFGSVENRDECCIHPNEPVCFGCAATATVVNNLGPSNYGALYYEYDLSKFEDTIDALRQLRPFLFLDYYSVDETTIDWAKDYIYDNLQALFDCYTSDQLDSYEKFASELRQRGY